MHRRELPRHIHSGDRGLRQEIETGGKEMRKGIGASIAIAAVMVATFGAPASATHGGIHPTFRVEENFFKCLASNKVQNVGRNQGEIPTWNTTAPTQALTAGGGCVQYENLLTHNNTTQSTEDLVFVGTFTGNLDSLKIELNLAHVSSFAASEIYFGISNLYVDGELMHTSDFFNFPTVNTSDATDKFTFSYTDLNFDDEDGDGTIEREVQLTVSSANEEQVAWLWDATDAASTITFNAPKVGINFDVNR